MDADLSKQMHQLLTTEKVALISADYDALIPLEKQKADILAVLAKRKTSQKALENIRKRIDENQALLTAAISGVAAARRRLDALNDVQNGLTVYDRSGKMEVVTAKRGEFEKKA